MQSEAFGIVERRRGVDQASQPGDEPAAGRRQSVLADVSGVTAVTQCESRPQDLLHLEGPRAVGVVFLQVLAAPQQVPHTGLVHGAVEAAIHHPPVAYQYAVEVGFEHGGGVVEAAAGADGVERRLRGGEDPQPVADGTDPPAGLVGNDHGTVAHLLAQQPVERRRVAGDPMQQVHQTARGYLQAEGGPQQLGQLGQRHAHLDVHLHHQGGDAGAQLHTGRAECVRGLQPMPALDAPSAVRAVPDFDVEAAHRRGIISKS